MSSHFVFGNLAQEVPNQDVAFLNACGDGRRHADPNVAKALQLAPVVACHRYDLHPNAACFFCSANNAQAVAAGAKGDQDVTFPTMCLDLARIDLFEAVVVGNRSERGSIGVEGESRQRFTFFLEAADELGGEMLSIGSGAAVATEEDLLSGLQTCGDGLGCFENWPFDRGKSGYGLLMSLKNTLPNVRVRHAGSMAQELRPEPGR